MRTPKWFVTKHPSQFYFIIFSNLPKWMHAFGFFIFAILAVRCAQPPEDNKMIMIIDADTANEVDDLFAIVRALLEPSIKVLGLTSAQFHTSPLASDTTVLESQRMNEEIIKLMQIKNIDLPIGSNLPIQNKNIPASSEASAYIIKKAHSIPEDLVLHLVILGSCTNVASAILQDPAIIPKIKVHYIGFWHDPKTNFYNKDEFNSGNDTLAVEFLLNTPGLDFNVMSATTCQHLVFEKNDVDQHLDGKSGIAKYLVDRWENYDRWWTTEDPQKNKWIMWDLAIIEALIHPELSTIKSFQTPDENTDRFINIHTHIKTGEMIRDFWKHVDPYVASL